MNRVIEAFRVPTRRFVVGWAWASVAANSMLVLTGGAVRLTGSGLGCPTWPRCTDGSFVPHGALGIHGVIEFGNRTLTYVLIAVAVATWVAVWRWAGTTDRLRALATGIGLAVPLQGVIGGLTVLSDLNPWVVAFHLLVSFVLISLSVLLVMRVRGDRGEPVVRPVSWLVRLTYGALWAVLYVGTVVTGSGPHAGDAQAPRNGLSPQAMSQFHADLVFLLVGLSVGCVLVLRAVGASPRTVRVAVWLVVAECAQGAIGFIQYATDLPIVLVWFHMLGAAVLVVATTRLLLAVSPVPRESLTADRESPAAVGESLTPGGEPPPEGRESPTAGRG